jgi:translocation and assembly module TamA
LLHLFLLLLLTVVGMSCATTPDTVEPDVVNAQDLAETGTEPPVGSDIGYTVNIEGVDNPELRALLESVSEALIKREEKPASIAHLRRRAERDRERFLKALQSRAYYGASVDLTIDPPPKPTVLHYQVVPGAQYQLAKVDILPAPPFDPREEWVPSQEEIGLVLGQAATAEAILSAEKRLITLMNNRGYPFPKLGKRRVVVDHDTHTAEVTYPLEQGPRGNFGEVRVTGLEQVKEVVVQQAVPWEPGQPFAAREIEEFRSKLYGTGLFTLVEVRPLEAEIVNGQVPVQVELQERKHRTVSAGLEASTTDGAAARFSWEHRNILQLGHRLRLEGRVGTLGYGIDTTYEIPRWRRDHQSLENTLTLEREETDAFEATRMRASAMVSRIYDERLTVRAGLALRVSEVEQFGDTQNYQLLSTPLEARYDMSNDLLNPTRGYRLNGLIEPSLSLGGVSVPGFLKLEGEAIHYLQLGSPKWVLASRLHLGSILGADLEEIPPDLRFFVGGGGSIRGYEYQTAGPLVGNDPTGGRSVADISLEIRRQITDTLGAVVFVDAGTVSYEPYPAFEHDIFVGTGFGIRYFTPIGPIRFDVAVPLNRREEVDSYVEFYISIGQAF